MPTPLSRPHRAGKFVSFLSLLLVASTASRLTVIANQLRDAAGNFEVK